MMGNVSIGNKKRVEWGDDEEDLSPGEVFSQGRNILKLEATTSIRVAIEEAIKGLSETEKLEVLIPILGEIVDKTVIKPSKDVGKDNASELESIRALNARLEFNDPFIEFMTVTTSSVQKVQDDLKAEVEVYAKKLDDLLRTIRGGIKPRKLEVEDSKQEEPTAKDNVRAVPVREIMTYAGAIGAPTAQRPLSAATQRPVPVVRAIKKDFESGLLKFSLTSVDTRKELHEGILSYVEADEEYVIKIGGTVCGVGDYYIASPPKGKPHQEKHQLLQGKRCGHFEGKGCSKGIKCDFYHDYAISKKGAHKMRAFAQSYLLNTLLSIVDEETLIDRVEDFSEDKFRDLVQFVGMLMIRVLQIGEFLKKD